MAGAFLRNFFVRYVPTRFYRAIKRMALRISERKSRLPSSRIPPPSRTFVYGADQEFKIIGQEFLGYFIQLGGLKPEHKVLDIGCGIGRVALALADYISAGGEYRGFDIARDGITWCRENITARKPNFTFEAVDVYNKTYNPSGRLRAAEFSFPYPDGYFDFVYTTSVFTHMLPDDMAHYLAESARVMKPGGRCLHTFFLLTPESEALIEQGASLFDFHYQLADCRTVSRMEPEKAVAYNEEFIRELYARHKLNIIAPIHYGNWCGRRKYLSGQDIVLAEKA